MCRFGTLGCTDRYHRGPGVPMPSDPRAGETCESEIDLFDVGQDPRQLVVSAGRWFAASEPVTSTPVVFLGFRSEEVSELTPETARRLAVSLLAHADLAERHPVVL